jgi:hypothetical protein
MRLILTKTGNQVLKLLADEIETTRSYRETKSVDHSKTEYSKYEAQVASRPNRTKLIELNMNMYKPPNNVLNIYNSYRDNGEESVNSIIRQHGFENGDYQRSVSLKHILRKETVKGMKDKAVIEESIRLKNFKEQDFEFRTPIKPPIATAKIDSITEKSINTNAQNIITYISNKDSLSPKFLNKLAHYNEDRIMGLDKICQKLINSKEKVRLHNTEAINEDKLNNYRLSINEMDDSLNRVRTKALRHVEQDNTNKKLVFAHEDFKEKYWNEGVNRLHNPKTPKQRDLYISSTYDYYSNGNSRVGSLYSFK